MSGVKSHSLRTATQIRPSIILTDGSPLAGAYRSQTTHRGVGRVYGDSCNTLDQGSH
jgi:hypothetical protein